MGVFRYPVEIAPHPEGPYEQFNALVDTGSLYTWVPSAILRRLGLGPTGKRPFLVADGRIIERDVTEAVIQIDGQRAHTICVFTDERDQVLLGAYTLEGFGLAADPVNKRLVPMPAIPAVVVNPS
ncbi:MAG: aspartyl protease family protein [Dehalococcoidia bacterium]